MNPHKEPQLQKAVRYAVNLITEQNTPFKEALKISTKFYPVKKHIEKGVRNCFPSDYFIRRSKKAYAKKMNDAETIH